MEYKVIGQGGHTNLELRTSEITQVQLNKEVTKEPAKESNEYNEKDIKKAVEKLNKFLEDDNTHAEYSAHDKFQNTIMIKIIDNSTKEIIMEVPPKKILDMVAKMCELVGVVFDKKA